MCLNSLYLETILIGLLKSLTTKIPCVIFVLKSMRMTSFEIRLGRQPVSEPPFFSHT